MADITVSVHKFDDEFEQFQKLQRVGVMIGGKLGEAVLDMLAPHQDDVIKRAVSDD